MDLSTEWKGQQKRESMIWKIQPQKLATLGKREKQSKNEQILRFLQDSSKISKFPVIEVLEREERENRIKSAQRNNG